MQMYKAGPLSPSVKNLVGKLIPEECVNVNDRSLSKLPLEDRKGSNSLSLGSGKEEDSRRYSRRRDI